MISIGPFIKSYNMPSFEDFHFGKSPPSFTFRFLHKNEDPQLLN